MCRLIKFAARLLCGELICSREVNLEGKYEISRTTIRPRTLSADVPKFMIRRDLLTFLCVLPEQYLRTVFSMSPSNHWTLQNEFVFLPGKGYRWKNKTLKLAFFHCLCFFSTKVIGGKYQRGRGLSLNSSSVILRHVTKSSK